MRVLIAGCGDVGIATGLRLAQQGHEVFGLRRNTNALPQPIKPVAADLADLSTAPLPTVDHVVYCAAAKSFDEATYRAVYVTGLANLMARLEAQGQQIRRLIFTSSTGVYGPSNGAWVDETTPTEPPRFSGKILLEAESLVAYSSIPGVVVRLSGIYGPGRTRLLTSVQQGASYPPDPPAYGNRIHRDDCAGILTHLLQVPSPESIYLGTDDHPAPMQEVADWLRQQIALAGQPLTEAGVTSPPRRSSKRCSNQRIKNSGYRFTYPSYKDGYPDVIKAWAEAQTLA